MKKKSEREVAIPEDVVVLILCRLPLKALYRSKAVAKSWASLIQELEIRRPPLFLGFFYRIESKCARLWRKSRGYVKSADRIFRYIDSRRDGGGIHNSSIDPTLSFLPRGGGHVLDCCNGLVLYRCGSSYCFVCNPLTKSWTQLSILDVCARLDFDPQVSPHFKIVSFRASQSTRQLISVYSSETQRWRSYVTAIDRCYNLQMDRDRYYAYWKGRLYLVISTGVSYYSPGSGKIVRIELEHGEREWHEADCQPTYIEFPAAAAGTEKPGNVCLARGWRDKLCLAGFDFIHNNTEMRVRVWSLSTRDQSVWVMGHDRVVPCSLLRGYDPLVRRPQPVVVGFHPFLDDVVFIMRGSTFYALHLMKLSLVEVCSIGYGPWESGAATVYHFSPCVVDSLECRNLEEAATTN